MAALNPLCQTGKPLSPRNDSESQEMPGPTSRSPFSSPEFSTHHVQVRELSPPTTSEIYPSPHYSNTPLSTFNLKQHGYHQTLQRNPIYLPTYEQNWAEQLSNAMQSLGVDEETQQRIQKETQRLGATPVEMAVAGYSHIYGQNQPVGCVAQSPYGITTHENCCPDHTTETSRLPKQVSASTHEHSQTSWQVVDVPKTTTMGYSTTKARPSANLVAQRTLGEQMLELEKMGAQFEAFEISDQGKTVVADVAQEVAM